MIPHVPLFDKEFGGCGYDLRLNTRYCRIFVIKLKLQTHVSAHLWYGLTKLGVGDCGHFVDCAEVNSLPELGTGVTRPEHRSLPVRWTSQFNNFSPFHLTVKGWKANIVSMRYSRPCLTLNSCIQFIFGSPLRMTRPWSFLNDLASGFESLFGFVSTRCRKVKSD